MMEKMDYNTIKTIAKERGINTTDLLAMSAGRDPFNIGKPAEIKQARWAYNIWCDMGRPENVHLRRIYYWFVSQKNPTRYSGERFMNQKKDWQHLAESFAAARILNLIPFHSIADHKHPTPEVNLVVGEDQDIRIDSNTCWSGDIPPDRIRVSIDDVFLRDSEIYYDSLEPLLDLGKRLPYHIEIWVEKSTLSDVFMNVKRKYPMINIQEGEGELSYTRVLDLIKRMKKYNKPVRIFYISDFDPMGYNMPNSIARKIEFFMDQEGIELDVKLNPLILTKEQCIKYNLPRIPLKDTESKKEQWENKQGEGATELDALEALHPGKIGLLIESAISPYYPEEFVGAWADYVHEYHNAIRDFNFSLDECIDELIKPIERDIKEKLLEAVGDKNIPYVLDVAAAKKELDEKLDDLIEPTPEPPAEPGNWLFDSVRGYEEQIGFYKKYARGELNESLHRG